MDKRINKQQLLLEYLVSSADTFAICKSIVKADYFNPEYRKAVNFVHTYYDNYSTTPSVDQIEAETSTILKTRTITRDEISYCSDEIEQFCKQKALEAAVVQASSLLSSGDGGKIDQIIREAVSVSLTKDLGIHYFENPLQRLQKSINTTERTPTGWSAVDELLTGGLARTELLLVSANSGGGKSITLANLAINMVTQGLNVLYITLELSEELVSQRFDTMFTSIPSVNWRNHVDHIADIVETVGSTSGDLTIHRMPSGTTSNAIRGYIKEYELRRNMVPDLLIVDYLDLMGSNESVSADNISEKDKRATEQLVDILVDYSMFGATASQQNRSAIDAAELNQSHIAGGLTKVNAADWYLSIVMTPTMKAAGEMMFYFLKSRSSDAVGKSVSLKWNNTSLRITNADNAIKQDNMIQQKINSLKKDESIPKRSLLDIMDL